MKGSYLKNMIVAGFAALGLAGLALTPVQAHHCKGGHAGQEGCGGVGGGDGLRLQGELSDDPMDPYSFQSDGEGLYFDGVGKVSFFTGGTSQPNPPGIFLSMKGKGKDHVW